MRLALWMVRGISSRSIRLLEQAFGSYDAAALRSREELAHAMGLREGATRQLFAAPEDLLSWASAEEAGLLVRSARSLLRGDPDYPDFGGLADPPEAFTLRGALGGAGRVDASGAPEAVAVVGARKADPGALIQAHRVGFALARAGTTVVSGGAFGVDARAHRGAIDGGGHTVAVLGSGVLFPLPAGNRRLFAEILEAGGALASELPPRENARPEFFPRRNRLVAGLSRAVVVIRAGAESGSLYTARAALALGRPVYVFPSQGRGASNAGSLLLEKEGAIALEDDSELSAALEGVGGEVARASPKRPASDEERVLEALGGPPASVAEVSHATGIPPLLVASIVGRLCAGGQVRSSGPGKFITCGAS